MSLKNKKTPIFIHSGWRSCGTYFWKKFREISEYKAYYEPFHEDHLYLDLKMAKNRFNKKALKELKHPEDINEFYYSEYNMKNGMKIPKFKENLIFKDMDADNNLDKDYSIMKDYIQYLLDLSYKENKVPVMKFSRSFFRIKWLKNNFNSLNIGIIRDPKDQWHSYMNINKDYFNAMTFLTILYCDKEFEELQQNFNMNKINKNEIDFFKLKDSICCNIIHKLSNSDLYYYFYYVRKKSIRNLYSNCDFIIKSDKLDKYRDHYEKTLNTVYGIDLDFSDFKYSKNKYNFLSENEMMSIEDKVNIKLGI